MSRSLLEARDIGKLENNYRGYERAICPIRSFYTRSDEFSIIPVIRDDGIRLVRRRSTRALFQTFVTNEINFRSGSKWDGTLPISSFSLRRRQS